ncbi:Ornithine decarboxylase [Vitis vinifera]|uniref:Ornithine decarboxylase n=1 Tax=Vitis vinifera TaxID=29760 RepID=A0A438JQ91_VITVI|nr:Ornithine decarboxylase [Vitis vinifera]
MMVKPLLGGSEWMNKAKFSSTVFGPTCDSTDMVVAESQLPELHMNDVLVFYNMGAYTASAGTRFNGFDISSISTFLTGAISGLFARLINEESLRVVALEIRSYFLLKGLKD